MLFLSFSQEYPKYIIRRPMGENSPNLVTLLSAKKCPADASPSKTKKIWTTRFAVALLPFAHLFYR
jgi:hypothetical protein